MCSELSHVGHPFMPGKYFKLCLWHLTLQRHRAKEYLWLINPCTEKQVSYRHNFFAEWSLCSSTGTSATVPQCHRKAYGSFFSCKETSEAVSIRSYPFTIHCSFSYCTTVVSKCLRRRRNLLLAFLTHIGEWVFKSISGSFSAASSSRLAHFHQSWKASHSQQMTTPHD